MSNVTENTSQAPLDEREVDEYLTGGSAYSRVYREVEADDVPDDLDRTVLAEAQAAVAKRKGMNWRRAMPTLAIAATAVLTISVVMRSGLESSKSPEQELREEFAAAVGEQKKAEAKPSVPASADEAQTVPVQIVPAEPPKVALQEAPAFAEMPAPAAAAPAAPAPGLAAGVADAERKLEKDSGIGANSRADANAPGLALKKEVVVTGSYLRQAGQDTALPVDKLTSEDLAKAKADAQTSQSAAARSAAPPVPAAAVTSRETTTVLEEAVVTGQFRSNPAAQAGPRGTVAVQTQSSADRRAERESREANPQYWLSYIRELRADNKASAADREWERFVKAYPNYSVAADDRARPKK